MAEAFLGEIRVFAGTFAPHNWALCNGQALSISSYQALYSLLGTTYGGDGVSTFALPDMRGRLPVHKGDGLGLTSRPLGSRYGTETVTLTEDQIPAHNHPIQTSTSAPDQNVAVGNMLASGGAVKVYNENPAQSSIKDFSPEAVGYQGGGQAHYNMMPYLCMNFIICLVGTYPSRN
ncbi:MAG: phage tail protein [Oceanospirillaceae bacterium]|nr:phage tail protein [Oceanospirillaceae bacterium]